MMPLTLVNRYCLNRVARQATFWKPKHYQAIPHYIKPHFIDIHDTYTLRSLQEVRAELTSQPYEITIQRVIYKPTDIRRDMKGRKAIILVDMQQFKLTEFQLARFKVLVGCRFDQKTNQLKLTCEMFDNFDQNFTKIHEMFHDIILQTKRAP